MDDVLDLTRVTKKWAEVTVTATDAAGAPIAVTGVSFAVLPSKNTPAAGTVWTAAATFAGGVARILLAALDVAPVAGSVVVPAGLSGLWARVVDAQETDVVLVKRLRVQ